MTSSRALSLGVVIGALLLLAPNAFAQAQSGLGNQLDDPTGQAPIRAHETPFGDDAVPTPPSYNAIAEEPLDEAGREQMFVRDRLRVLDAHWATLGAQGLNYTNSVFSLAGGAALIVIGGVLLEVGGGMESLAPLLFVIGGVGIARTIVVDFILRPNPQPLALQYASMPSGTRAQQLARLRYGEEQLESIAEQSKILRFVDSSINIASVAAMLGVYFGLRDDTADFQPIELLFFIGPAISTVIAFINLFSPSGAEQRWDAYRRMRDRQGGEVSSVHVEPIIAADPRGGGFAGLRGTF